MELLTYRFPKTSYRDFSGIPYWEGFVTKFFSIPYRGNFVARFSGVPYRENFVRRFTGISYQGNLVRRFPGMKIAQSDNIIARFPCYYVSHIARSS